MIILGIVVWFWIDGLFSTTNLIEIEPFKKCATWIENFKVIHKVNPNANPRILDAILSWLIGEWTEIWLSIEIKITSNHHFLRQCHTKVYVKWLRANLLETVDGPTETSSFSHTIIFSSLSLSFTLGFGHNIRKYLKRKVLTNEFLQYVWFSLSLPLFVHLRQISMPFLILVIQSDILTDHQNIKKKNRKKRANHTHTEHTLNYNNNNGNYSVCRYYN